jgi:hypothetical protein
LRDVGSPMHDIGREGHGTAHCYGVSRAAKVETVAARASYEALTRASGPFLKRRITRKAATHPPGYYSTVTQALRRRAYVAHFQHRSSLWNLRIRLDKRKASCTRTGRAVVCALYSASGLDQQQRFAQYRHHVEQGIMGNISSLAASMQKQVLNSAWWARR